MNNQETSALKKELLSTANRIAELGLKLARALRENKGEEITARFERLDASMGIMQEAADLHTLASKIVAP